jgi:heme-degrading monooxygenase HmoA
MIERIWHGWTLPENADTYENLLKTEIFPVKNIPGYRGIRLLRRPLDGEVEFITIMLFDSLEDVIRFAGEDYEKSYVPQKAREVLARFDERSQHYEVREELKY